jgi:adenylylsulfate kinase-like enzyme
LRLFEELGFLEAERLENLRRMYSVGADAYHEF